MHGSVGVPEVSRAGLINHKRTFWLTFVACMLPLFFCNQPARAQVLFGSVVGNVTDTTGAAIPSAVVKITEMRTNETRSATANETGA